MTNKQRITRLLKAIKFIVFDFDGVFTDNSVYVDTQGREMVKCSRGDGIGLDFLRELGIPMLILSSEKNPVVKKRAMKLKIRCIHGVEDKADELRKICMGLKISPRSTAYVGNDLNDLSVMKFVGFPIAVANAHPEVRRAAKWTLKVSGGDGAVREFCEIVYKARTGARRVK